MNNTNRTRGRAGDGISKDYLVYLDLSMALTKSEFSEVQTIAKFLGMGNMEEYCKYSILKIAEAHYHEMYATQPILSSYSVHQQH